MCAIEFQAWPALTTPATTSSLTSLSTTRTTGEPAAGPVAELAELPAGLRLLTALTALGIDGLDAHDTVIVIAAWERLMRYSSAAQLTVIARLPECDEYQFCSAPQKDVERPHTHDPVDPAGDELSLALAVSPAAAKNLLVCAQELASDLPDTLHAVAEGGVDARRARLICERTRVLDPVGRREVEAVVLPAAPGLTYVQLDRWLRRAVIAADPAGAEARRRRAHIERRVEAPRPDILDARDGMAQLQVVGPAEDLVALYTALDAAARHQRASGDARTLDQLRFDALTGVGWNALDLGHLGCCHPACTHWGDADVRRS